MPDLVLRDIKVQHNEVKLQQQQKKSAQEAIKDMSQQQDQQRALSKKLVKARMELELLLIDEKYVVSHPAECLRMFRHGTSLNAEPQTA